MHRVVTEEGSYKAAKKMDCYISGNWHRLPLTALKAWQTLGYLQRPKTTEHNHNKKKSVIADYQ